MPFAIAAGVTAVGGIASGLISAGAAKDAASIQAAAANRSADLQQAQFTQNQANLAPYRTTGESNLPAYADFYKSSQNDLNAAFTAAQNAIPQNIQPMDQASLQKTPGYQFNLSQGLRAVQNSAAAKGLGVSGAAMQGAASYATGLADSTYQNQFNNAQTIFGNNQLLYGDALNQANLKQNQLGTVFGQIQAPIVTGENAAATAGQQGTQGAANIGNALVQAGNAQAAGINGSANALGNALNSGSNNAALFALLQKQNGGATPGGGGFTTLDASQNPSAGNVFAGGLT